MKKIVVLISIGLMFSCSDSKQGALWVDNRLNLNVIKSDIQIMEYEGCEYLIYSGSTGYQGYAFGAHKGNCKNPIHECK